MIPSTYVPAKDVEETFSALAEGSRRRVGIYRLDNGGYGDPVF